MLKLGQDNTESASALNQLISVLRGIAAWVGQASDTAGRQRVVVESFPATVPTVTTVSNVQNQTNIGGMIASDQIPALLMMGAQNLRNQITVG